MHPPRIIVAALVCLASGASGQHIVKVPQSEAKVSRPDDLFALAPDQWHFGRHLWQGQEPCTDTECEAGFTSGDLAVSAEHAGNFVRIIAGFRGCEAVGYSEVEVGQKPGKATFGRLRKQVERVVKGVSKSCTVTAPVVSPLDARQLFPASPPD